MCITEHHLLNNENSFTVLISKTDFNRRFPGRMGHRFIFSFETDVLTLIGIYSSFLKFNISSFAL